MANTSWSLQGRTCLITGITQGIGRITAQELAPTGCRLLLVARDPHRGAAVVDELKAKSKNPQIELLLADLSRMADVRKLAANVKSRTDRLDVLINNAGALFMSRQLSPDGFEMTFALNHLAYFLLTQELLPLIEKTASDHDFARIINVASNAHHRAGSLDFDDIMHERSYNGFQVYCRSKLANLLFTFELARRLQQRGVHNVSVNCLHPGFVASGFGHNNSPLMQVVMKIAGVFAISPEEGAKTTLYLATSPDVQRETGRYFAKSRPARCSRDANDLDTARRLWDLSEKLLAR